MQTRPVADPVEDNIFYMEIWRDRPHVCQCCSKDLFEPLKYMFHHILEKRGKAHKHEDYTRFRHCKWNILLLCWDCHNSYESNADNQPTIHNEKLHLLDIIENKLYDYDRNFIWVLDVTLPMNNLHSLFPKTQLIFIYD